MTRIAAASLALLFAVAPLARAQISYPSFQIPHVVEREFNFFVADASLTTTLGVQWREQIGARSQLSLDLGFADGGRVTDDVFLVVGGQYGAQLSRASGSNPLDVMLTAGLFMRMGGDGGDALSVPLGVSFGHRFPLEGNMAITPYVHPRISIDSFNDNNELNVRFDFGGSLEISNEIGVRLSVALGENDALGFSIAWRPLGLSR